MADSIETPVGVSVPSSEMTSELADEHLQQAVNPHTKNEQNRSSRRKPATTRKVAADVAYGDYLKSGIPNALLKGLGLTDGNQRSESGSPQSSDDILDNPPSPDDHDVSINTAAAVVSPYRRLHTATPEKKNNDRANAASARQTLQKTSQSRATAEPTPTVGAVSSQKRRNQETSVRKPNSSTAAPAVLLPVTQNNVGQVLEKMLAATQSMGMLLGSLKDDLRRASLPNAVGVDPQKKRRDAATKLWRAFIAYKRSFEDIETYSKSSGGGIIAPLLSSTPPMPRPASLPVPPIPRSVQPVARSVHPVVRYIPVQPAPPAPRPVATVAATPSSRHQSSRHQKQTESDPPYKSSARVSTGASRKQTRSSSGVVAPPADFVVELSDSEDEDVEEPARKRPNRRRRQSSNSDNNGVNAAAVASYEVMAVWDKTEFDGDATDDKLDAVDAAISPVGVAAAVRSTRSEITRDPEERGSSGGNGLLVDCSEEPNEAGNDADSADGSNGNGSSSSGSNETSSANRASKPELFGSLRFEPLFEIKPVNNADS